MEGTMDAMSTPALLSGPLDPLPLGAQLSLCGSPLFHMCCHTLTVPLPPFRHYISIICLIC